MFIKMIHLFKDEYIVLSLLKDKWVKYLYLLKINKYNYIKNKIKIYLKIYYYYKIYYKIKIIKKNLYIIFLIKNFISNAYTKVF